MEQVTSRTYYEYRRSQDANKATPKLVEVEVEATSSSSGSSASSSSSSEEEPMKNQDKPNETTWTYVSSEDAPRIVTRVWAIYSSGSSDELCS